MSYVAGAGLSAITYTAAMPIEAMSGFIGHPDAVEYFAKASRCPSGAYVHALALMESGELESADAEFAKIGSAAALNNRGVIAARRGEAGAAKGFWTKALEADGSLAEAKFNLGQDAASARIERLKKYGGTGPLAVMPTATEWADMAVAGGSQKGALSLILQNNGALGTVAGPEVARYVSVVLVAVMVLFALATIALPRCGADHDRRTWSSLFAWVLGFVIPGTARLWMFAGVFALAAFFFSISVEKSLETSAGIATNMIEAIAVPGTLRCFGFGAECSTPLNDAMRSTRHLWWILLLLNAVMMLAMLKFWPDPGGITGKPPAGPEQKPVPPETGKESTG
jgi:hypothetical protein